MSADECMVIVSMVIVRGIIVLFGGLSMYWGWRLFYIERPPNVMTEKQGEFTIRAGKHQFSIKDVAAGIFFALFGAAILVSCLIYPIYYVSDGVKKTIYAVYRLLNSVPS